MSIVLFTEQNGFGAVFVREVTIQGGPFGIDKQAIDLAAKYKLRTAWVHERKASPYSPRPGTANAVGCWSRVEDLG